MLFEKLTCFCRSVVLVVEPHSRSTEPFWTSVMRFRGDRHQLDVELGELQFGLDRIDRLEHHFLRVADDLLLVVVVRERDRRLPMPQGDDPGFLDLLQRTGQIPAPEPDSTSARWQALQQWRSAVKW
jgi:hypothetical protein